MFEVSGKQERLAIFTHSQYSVDFTLSSTTSKHSSIYSNKEYTLTNQKCYRGLFEVSFPDTWFSDQLAIIQGYVVGPASVSLTK